jgi:hypothetical protein
MTTLLIIAFFVWLITACTLAIDIATPEMRPVRICARRDTHRR